MLRCPVEYSCEPPLRTFEPWKAKGRPSIRRLGWLAAVPLLALRLPAAAPRLPRAQAVIRAAIAAHAFPGAALAVGWRGRSIALRGFGHFTYAPGSPRVTANTIYDLASLSKVVGTTSALMMLYDRHRFRLREPLVRILPGFGHIPAGERGDPLWPARRRVTLFELLTHTSGLPPWLPLYKCGLPGFNCSIPGYSGPDTGLPYPVPPYLLRAAVEQVPLVAYPATKYAYSDFNFMLLGQVVERLSHLPLNLFLARRLFRPLRLRSTLYQPPRRLWRRIPPEEYDAVYRHILVHGFVHDENAYALDGVAGHAGLFSSARDLARFARLLLAGGRYRGRRYFRSATVRLFTRRAPTVLADLGLGWDKRTDISDTIPWFSRQSYGHTGFTGTSIWIDPVRRLYIVLLTNRVYPTRANHQIMQVRRELYRAVFDDLGLAPRGAAGSEGRR